ncbi:MAG: leucyl/phenylalanyl-tRNA--protein transferase [Ilumatobacteraceae bacterium]
MTIQISWNSHPDDLGLCRWEFPPSENWPDSDLVGSGADLEPSTLIHGYRRGVFAMPAEPDSQSPDLAWWSPVTRAVLPLDGLIITRSMRRSSKRYNIRVDTSFEAVMRGCAAPHRSGAWINQEFIDAYVRLHQLGWAHSVEAFDEYDQLVGGLYGVRIGNFFAGESMFHLARDASKVALMTLVNMMNDSSMLMLDVQWQTPHLASLGAVEIDRHDYLARLSLAVTP